MDYYKILNVESNCDFQALKKAYYRRAKQCHPDLFNNSPQKTEEFKLVVIAFDILSDPGKRRLYDLKFKPGDEFTGDEAVATIENAIMDTAADDILEELIVGNICPEHATLATLFLDLAKTDIFITFREGKNLFHEKRFQAAKSFLAQAVANAPQNILYRIYLARDLAILRELRLAKYHYRTALNIGQRRFPPQNLFRIRQELKTVNKQSYPFLNALLKLFKSEESRMLTDPTEEMIDQTSRELTRLAKIDKLAQTSRKQLK